VGTHDDITERRLVERRNALLDEQEARRAQVEEAIAWFRQSIDGILKTVADSLRRCSRWQAYWRQLRARRSPSIG
jgi:hypothetical protein